MSTGRKRILLAVLSLLLLAAAGWGAWYLFRKEDPEAAVRRTWTELISLLEKSGSEGIVVQMDKAKKASKKCAGILHVSLPRYRESDMNRKDVIQTVLTARKLAADITIRIYDMTVRFNNRGTVALAGFSASVKGKGVSGGTFHEVREFDTELVHEDGQWLLRKVAFRRVLNK